MFRSGSARILYSLFCCLSLLTGDYAFRPGVQPLAASADAEVVGRVRPDRVGAPALKGDQAISWLRHRGIYDSLRSSIEADRYQMQWEDGAYHTTNPPQNLRARFTPTGISVAVVGDEARDRQLGVLHGFRRQRRQRGLRHVDGARGGVEPLAKAAALVLLDQLLQRVVGLR